MSHYVCRTRIWRDRGAEQRAHRNLAALVEDIQAVPFDAAAAEVYGPISAATRDRKKDHLDKLIAAHAVALNVSLVTNNERDFIAYPGLKIDNWRDE